MTIPALSSGVRPLIGRSCGGSVCGPIGGHATAGLQICASVSRAHLACISALLQRLRGAVVDDVGDLRRGQVSVDQRVALALCPRWSDNSPASVISLALSRIDLLTLRP
jgi:hypothetical protein